MPKKPLTGFVHIRPIDQEQLFGGDPSARARLPMLDRSSGAEHLSLVMIRTPPGGGSPEGLHVHRFEQAFYLVSGTMTIEIDGVQEEAGTGSIIVFPAGQPHRNWNSGSVDTVHLSIGAPLPDDGAPYSIPAP